MLITIPLSDSSRNILAVYKKSRGIKSTNDVIESFIQEFGRGISPTPSPIPVPTPPEPVSSTIIAEGCTWSGKKTALQSGSTFEER